MFDRRLTRYLERRDEEIRVRDERWDAEAKRRDAEAKRRDEEAKRRDEEAKSRAEEWKQASKEREEEFKGLCARLDAQMVETREFNREILLRNEKVYTSVIAEMEEGRKQIRANTQAVLSMLDRFNGSSA